MYNTELQSLSNYQEIVSEINNVTGIRIIPFNEDKEVTKNTPHKLELLSKITTSYPDGIEQDLLKSTVNMFYDFLDAPIVDFPNTRNDLLNIDSVIDTYEDEISNMFEDDTTKQQTAHMILTNNRLRANVLGSVVSSIQTILYFSDILPPALIDQFKTIHNLTVGFADTTTYKNRPYEDKVKIAVMYSKAAELSLRILDGQKISDEEYEILESLKPTTQSATIAV